MGATMGLCHPSWWTAGQPRRELLKTLSFWLTVLRCSSKRKKKLSKKLKTLKREPKILSTSRRETQTKTISKTKCRISRRFTKDSFRRKTMLTKCNKRKPSSKGKKTCALKTSKTLSTWSKQSLRLLTSWWCNNKTISSAKAIQSKWLESKRWRLLKEGSLKLCRRDSNRDRS